MKSVISQVINAIDTAKNSKLSHVTYNGECVTFYTDAANRIGTPEISADPAEKWLQENGVTGQGNTSRQR